MGEEPIDVHRELLGLARTYGRALDEVAARVFEIDSATPEKLPEEAEALERGIARFLARYEEWDPKGPRWVEGPSSP